MSTGTETCAVIVNRITNTGMVDTATIAHVADVTPRSVQRWQRGTADPRPPALQRLLELREVLDLTSVVYRPDGAALWLRSPVPALGYERPVDLMRAGQFRLVISSLLALAEGVTFP